uniref:Uncharacterized protein n=1 Tax=Chromera velia CCMP2878 TaxID=1169474 RepID=A0A0G4I5N2_9ALVE|mmetsp:Transcript_29258/g.57440  ORF Transcript_29258/g.57440 Transcript_29258/m.57440 type:complete len:94 (+) Transcript_29258:231-512(+)|eukprot:Cvel_11185.t1-p1 / transcript=Cvel_11185.t1 / gene=Cvel_11185 / organism=Chromera_velia_CCMP2878 / gene_product=hypothetical protein / transcript_product=hypothetical protein / location=Cvel_scaffold694:47985-50781(-) / protein_length=93 / sequence_SO=supercontig / SO=protein_coding / is_pseudo=false
MDECLSKLLKSNADYSGALVLNEQGLLLGVKGEVPVETSQFHKIVAATRQDAQTDGLCFDTPSRSILAKEKHGMTLVIFKQKPPPPVPAPPPT